MISPPSAASLGNRPASSPAPSEVPALTQPGLLDHGDVAVIGRADRVGLGNVVQRVETMPVPDAHVFQDQGHDRHVHLEMMRDDPRCLVPKPELTVRIRRLGD